MTSLKVTYYKDPCTDRWKAFGALPSGWSAWIWSHRREPFYTYVNRFVPRDGLLGRLGFVRRIRVRLPTDGEVREGEEIALRRDREELARILGVEP